MSTFGNDVVAEHEHTSLSKFKFKFTPSSTCLVVETPVPQSSSAHCHCLPTPPRLLIVFVSSAAVFSQPPSPCSTVAYDIHYLVSGRQASMYERVQLVQRSSACLLRLSGYSGFPGVLSLLRVTLCYWQPGWQHGLKQSSIRFRQLLDTAFHVVDLPILLALLR